MLFAVVLLSALSVCSLYILKPLFLTLRAREVLDFAIVQIFAIVGIGIQGVLIRHHFKG